MVCGFWRKGRSGREASYSDNMKMRKENRREPRRAAGGGVGHVDSPRKAGKPAGRNEGEELGASWHQSEV